MVTLKLRITPLLVNFKDYIFLLYKKTKIFWDIDGTLLQTHGAAAVPFANAVSKFAGYEVQIERKKLSGFTDYEIAQYLLKSINFTVFGYGTGKITTLPSYYVITS